uniref:LMBR1-like conserved region-containing protein n=1 Tax=Neobodo designis TaxID=312471 RepID=A0A7S1PTF4_NEODS|mmetsp:Transcript_19031/g.59045  ORF Transcript_19031/g.59045 Transcript_19031/m.59045 type:complete len:481 (+) Transcript_19031:60-1502(+)|eukprot:CAMPEP_0174853266 /NCGR_PEP_ID=MMETSP1114-20130205/27730_1 /TAXON_ID=312471 /ORGANISM="Neobodo designis, Strain CCAP 1951/1" /LENGTH=480 /DNA_ID=CAMNT_0016087899 /DNA_START=61 /DNA_END=1503 /DNA_ORIENTATION=+
MNWWLVIVAILMAFVVLGLVFYLVFLYQHEEDRNQAWLPKCIVIFGLSLACFNVLLLPYDVANRQDPDVQNSVGGGINTVLCWQIVMWSIAVMTVFVVPFAIFYYEGLDPDQKNICNQLKPAICYTTITSLLFIILLVVLWVTVGDAEIDYHLYRANGGVVQGFIEMCPWAPYQYQSGSAPATLTIKVSPFVYMCGLLSAFGWILFFLFGGIGLAALPMDLISDFKNRPKPITVQEYTLRKENIGRETQALMAEGRQLEEAEENGSTGRKHKKKMLAFKAKVAALEDAYEKLTVSYEEGGGKVLPLYLGLLVGCIGTVMSIMWVLQILIHNILDASPLLSSMFIAMDSGFTLFGTVAYGMFAFYLLWCVVKGCTKFGLNLLLFTVHPMKIGGTMMNSFLFNTMLILIASVSCVQFCAMSFRDYAANTAVDALYLTYVSRLKGINYVNEYMQYPMGAIAILAFLWLAICPKCKRDDDEDDD